MTEAIKLYTPERLDRYDTAELDVLAAMTEHDITCPNSFYSSMSRAETIATARQSNQDIRAEIATRAAKALKREIAHNESTYR